MKREQRFSLFPHEEKKHPLSISTLLQKLFREITVSTTAQRFMDTFGALFQEEAQGARQELPALLFCAIPVFSLSKVFSQPPPTVGRLSCFPFWASRAFVCLLCYSESTCNYLYLILDHQKLALYLVHSTCSKKEYKKMLNLRGIYSQVFHKTEIEVRGTKLKREIFIIPT